MFAILASTGCAATGTYIHNETPLQISIDAGPRHELGYLRTYLDGGELVVYGRLEHLHPPCYGAEGVELTVTDGNGVRRLLQGVPVRRVVSLKLHGWYGASFRARLVPPPSQGAQISLAVRDEACVPG